MFIRITGSFLNIDMCKGRGPVIIVRQNYIRLDPNEPNLPAWVPRSQGPLTREQQKVLVGHGFPVLFSSGLLMFWGFLFLFLFCCCLGGGLFLFCGPECGYIEHISPGWNMHACMCMCVPTKLFCKWKGTTSRPR